MQKTIWKYLLVHQHQQTIRMPAGAEILSVQAQLGEPHLWALVDPEAPEADRTFRLYGTGHPIDPGLDLRYVGTVLLLGGGFVTHLFEDKTNG